MILIKMILAWFRGPPLQFCAHCNRPMFESMLGPAGERERMRQGSRPVETCIRQEDKCGGYEMSGYYDQREEG